MSGSYREREFCDMYAIQTVNGIVFDRCKSEGEHLLAPKPERLERRNCRISAEELLPADLIEDLRRDGVTRRGSWRIVVEFMPEGEECPWCGGAIPATSIAAVIHCGACDKWCRREGLWRLVRIEPGAMP